MMGYKGRIIAILFIIFFRALFIFIDIIQHVEINFIEMILTISILIPMYFFGLQYDKAKYYSKEIDDLFEDSHIMLWNWETMNDMAIVSSGCEQIYGYSRKEFQHDANLWLKLVYQKDQNIAQKFENETRKGKRYSTQYRIVHKSGKMKWIQNMANPVFDENRKFIKLNGVTIDITKQKEIDLHYKKLIDASPVAMIILKKEEISFVNREGLKLLGTESLDQVIGKKIYSFFLEEHQMIIQRINELLVGEEEKLPLQEYKIQGLNGTVIDVESTGIKTIYDDEETIMVVIKNITEDKKMKVKLKEAEEKYRSISEEALVGVYMFEDGRVTYINKEVERILGYSREEIANMNVLELFVEKEQDLVANNIAQMLDSDTKSFTEDLLTGCNPALLEFEITESVMQDVFSSIKIVTELKEMGIKISIDDFGTGYSNLSILSEMDIDILKIDRSFVEKMSENTKSLSLVKTIINMGHSLGFEIVAEGIETLEQLLLKHFHCDIGQGYYFSPPLSIEEIVK